MQDTINHRSFDQFCLWFGKTAKILRYTKSICQLWTSGLIYGFMSREDIEMSLVGYPTGTFIIRFSERFVSCCCLVDCFSCPGQFAIGYVGAAGALKHYLVEPKDLLNTSLPNFLECCDQFTEILHVIYF